MLGVVPQYAGKEARPSLGGEAGGRSPGFISFSFIVGARRKGKGTPLMRPPGSSSGVLVLVTDGYGRLIKLGVWDFSADSPLQYAEFGVVPFGFPTIHPPCVSLLRARLR